MKPNPNPALEILVSEKAEEYKAVSEELDENLLEKIRRRHQRTIANVCNYVNVDEISYLKKYGEMIK